MQPRRPSQTACPERYLFADASPTKPHPPEDGFRCPVCYAVIPPEHISRKAHCRRCGYLES